MVKDALVTAQLMITERRIVVFTRLVKLVVKKLSFLSGEPEMNSTD